MKQPEMAEGDISNSRAVPDDVRRVLGESALYCAECEGWHHVEYHARRPSRADLIASYESKVQDFAAETRRTSAALKACAQRGDRAPLDSVKNDIGWDLAMEWVEDCVSGADPSVCGDGIHLSVCVLPAGHGLDVLHSNEKGSRWGHG